MFVFVAQHEVTDVLVSGQGTRRQRSTRIPVHSGSPGDTGCSTAPAAWAEGAGTGRSLCPSCVQALWRNPAPTPLHTDTGLEQPNDRKWCHSPKHRTAYRFWWQSSWFGWHLPLPEPETVSAQMLLKKRDMRQTNQNSGWGGVKQVRQSRVSKNLRSTSGRKFDPLPGSHTITLSDSGRTQTDVEVREKRSFVKNRLN